MKILYGQKNGFYAFGYNCDEIEPIWMKFGITEPNVGGWPRQILCVICAVATVWEGAEILFVW